MMPAVDGSLSGGLGLLLGLVLILGGRDASSSRAGQRADDGSR